MWSIQTVFIPRENIYLIEQWLKYHYSIGCSHIYLYDNSESQFIDNGNNINKTGKNKYSHNIKSIMNHLSDDEIFTFYSKLLEKYKGKLDIVKWSPVVNNRVIYGQYEAIIDYSNRFKPVTWTLFIDIDEFLCVPEDIIKNIDTTGVDVDFNLMVKHFIDNLLLSHQLSNINRIDLKQIKMHHHLNRLIECERKEEFNIKDCKASYHVPHKISEKWGLKSFVYMPHFDKNQISFIHEIKISSGAKRLVKDDSILFMHFNVCEKQINWFKNHYSTPVETHELIKIGDYDYLEKNFSDILAEESYLKIGQ